MNKEADKQKIRLFLGKGKDSAKHADQLAKQANISNVGRTQEYVRNLIRELIKEGIPIGSLSKYGFWIITNEKELDEVIKSLRNRVKGINKRVREIEKAFRGTQD